MSALTQFTDRASFKSAKARVNALQDAVGFETCDGLTMEDAARNLANRKPAFGWTTSYSNAPAGTFAAAVNHFASIERAQADLVAHFKRNGRDVTDECWLDNLLPLNREAVMDLLRAYQRVGTFRSPEELRRRTERHEYRALEAAE